MPCCRYVLSLQWKPPHGFTGEVRLLATVVADYRTYWAAVTSATITVTGPGADTSGEEEADYSYHYQEDNSVLESVVATRVLVDFQKRSTENEEEPPETSERVAAGTQTARAGAEARAVEVRGPATTRRSVLLWPSRRTKTTPAVVSRRAGLGSTPPPTTPDTAVTTFSAWWRLPVTLAPATAQDSFFRPTLLADPGPAAATSTRRSVLMQPRPRPAEPRPVPTIQSQKNDVDRKYNSYYGGHTQEDNIKIPVFINSIDRSDEGAASTESDIGLIPYFDRDVEDLVYQTTEANPYNRLKLSPKNQNVQPTTVKHRDKSNNIAEINAKVMNKDNAVDPYAKMEAEYGSWDNSATVASLPFVSFLFCLVLYSLLLDP